jgi:hypothetical protein
VDASTTGITNQQRGSALVARQFESLEGFVSRYRDGSFLRFCLNWHF